MSEHDSSVDLRGDTAGDPVGEPSGDLADDALMSTLAMTHASQKLGVVKAASDDVICPGTRIQQYEIIRELARGGMGVVYLARDTKLGRRVAVKVLRESERDVNAQIMLEARATARCVHENIVVIHEVDEYKGHPFMVLEYLSGEPLSKRLNGTPLPYNRAIELIVPVIRALACAHQQGIVHRDLKPENIVITDSGTIKVLDFGIAKVLGREDLSTQTDSVHVPEEAVLYMSDKGSLTGTLPFMSPEQWGRGEVDHRSDIWAVGIMLYVMLTGRHPLSPLSFDRLKRRMTGDVEEPMPGLGQAEGNVPDELAEVVDRCLIKDKNERTGSAAALLEGLEPFLPYGRKLASDISPYRGLKAFQESDAERFFGRSRDVGALVARLRDRALVGVVGPSGIGKSSFVRAGVIPALKSSGQDWESITMRPGRRPLTALANALAPLVGDRVPLTEAEMNAETITGSDPGVGDPDTDSEEIDDPGAGALHGQRSLLARMADEPGFIGTMLRDRARNKDRRIALFIDQFEETYTLGSDPDERRAFTACLLGMADDVATPLRVIIAARSDFLDRAAEDPGFMGELTQGLWFLPPPDRAGLREALTQPADMAGYRFESGKMVDELLDELEASKAALPLLQFTAAILWESRDRHRRMLTEESYARIGGIAGALAGHADAVLARLPAHKQRQARTMFRRLVTPEATRDIVPLDELCELAALPAEAADLVDHFVRARLLVAHSSGETDIPQVEIIHESLITSWPTLGRWLDENQEAAAFLAELRAAVKQWRGRGRSPDLLWRGEAEKEARRWHPLCAGELSDTESEFLDEVFALADRMTRRRRQLTIGVIVFLAGLVAAAAVALILIRDAEQMARQEADRAQKASTLAQQQASELLLKQQLISQQLEQIKRERAAAEQAEQRAEHAENLNFLTKAELIDALKTARRSRSEAETAKKRAEQAAIQARDAAGTSNAASKKAQQAVEQAQRATEAERQAKGKLERLLREKEDRIQQLRQKIITDKL